MADRKYDDKQIREILKAAAEMQSSSAHSGADDGMTLSELQTVAEEIGINPENIGRAASDLDRSLDRKSFRKRVSTPKLPSGTNFRSRLLRKWLGLVRVVSVIVAVFVLVFGILLSLIPAIVSGLRTTVRKHENRFKLRMMDLKPKTADLADQTTKPNDPLREHLASVIPGITEIEASRLQQGRNLE